MKHLKTSCISASTLMLVLALTAQAQPARSSLYADLGGDTGISNIIDESVLIFLQDARITAVTVKIVKLAIAEAGEKIGITLHRERRE